MVPTYTLRQTAKCCAARFLDSELSRSVIFGQGAPGLKSRPLFLLMANLV